MSNRCNLATSHTHPTYIIRNSLEHSPLMDSYYAINTHDVHPTHTACKPQTTHALYTPLTHHTHMHVCMHIPQEGFCIVKILLRERCFTLAAEATSPTKMHKDFSKECPLLLMSITCLINSQAWFEDLTWRLISIQGKINGELRGLVCWVSRI